MYYAVLYFPAADCVVSGSLKTSAVNFVYIHVWLLSVIPVTAWLFSYERKITFLFAGHRQNLGNLEIFWQFPHFYKISAHKKRIDLLGGRMMEMLIGFCFARSYGWMRSLRHDENKQKLII